MSGKQLLQLVLKLSETGARFKMNLVQFFKNHIKTFVFVIVFLAIPITVFIAQQQQEIRQHASTLNQISTRVLTVFGQIHQDESSRGQITDDQIDHASGVIVDKTTTPDSIYVADTGNNRILGYKGAGYCANTTTSCTTNSDCGGNTCVVNGSKKADIVIGQIDKLHGSCNGNNNTGVFQPPSASTLCFMGFPVVTNLGETWMRTNFSTDQEGNLYIPDSWNNRVLKYNQPLSTDKTNGKGDSIADFVWGQDNFSSNGINKGSPIEATTQRSNSSLFLNFGQLSNNDSFDHVTGRGVSVDTQNNVWVADTFNRRVLRFTQSSKTANLVLGQVDFSSASNAGCIDNGPLDKICTPTLAKVNPATGDLYVLDEHPQGFKARILVFRQPFTNGMSAYKVIQARQPTPLKDSNGSIAGWQPNGMYTFSATSLEFNTYKIGEYANGTIWVTENASKRVLLLDDDGNVIKIINARSIDQQGGGNFLNGCGMASEDGFNLEWPGGSMGFDSENNMYFADEHWHRIARFALPYTPRMINSIVCPPSPNGGLFPGQTPNADSNGRFNGGVGTAVFGDQLIVVDSRKIKVWNQFTTKPIGSNPDIVLQAGIPSRILFNKAVDDSNRLWLYDEHGQLKVYQLPFRGNDTPLAQNIRLYWPDTNEEIQYHFFETGITFDKTNKALYISDRDKHRVLRIKNYNEFQNKLFVDMVIGQPNKTSIKCNFNQTMSWLADGPPRADSLCHPYQVTFDPLGNLYIVENTYECHGNNRISVFMKEDLQNSQTLFPLIQAKKVFNQPNLTTQANMNNCAYSRTDGPGSPVSIAFNSKNEMVVGNDGYYGILSERHLKQLWLYETPLTKQTPDKIINVPLGASGELVFDSQDNLVVQDHTWNKVWIVQLIGETLPSVTPTIINTPTITNTPTPTTTFVPTISPTSILTPTTVVPTISGETFADLTISLIGIAIPPVSCTDISKCIDNPNPKHPTRSFVLEFYSTLAESSQIQPTHSILGELSFSPDKKFSASVLLPSNFQSGSYDVLIRVDEYLRKRIRGNLLITKGQHNILPETTILYKNIIDTDLDKNNLNILDFNAFKKCYNKRYTNTCQPSDFNDDEKVDFKDLTILTNTFSVKIGD